MTDLETKRQKMRDEYKKDLESKQYIKRNCYLKNAVHERDHQRKFRKISRLKKIVQ